MCQQKKKKKALKEIGVSLCTNIPGYSIITHTTVHACSVIITGYRLCLKCQHTIHDTPECHDNLKCVKVSMTYLVFKKKTQKKIS